MTVFIDTNSGPSISGGSPSNMNHMGNPIAIPPSGAPSTTVNGAPLQRRRALLPRNPTPYGSPNYGGNNGNNGDNNNNGNNADNHPNNDDGTNGDPPVALQVQRLLQQVGGGGSYRTYQPFQVLQPFILPSNNPVPSFPSTSPPSSVPSDNSGSRFSSSNLDSCASSNNPISSASSSNPDSSFSSEHPTPSFQLHQVDFSDESDSTLCSSSQSSTSKISAHAYSSSQLPVLSASDNPNFTQTTNLSSSPGESHSSSVTPSAAVLPSSTADSHSPGPTSSTELPLSSSEASSSCGMSTLSSCSTSASNFESNTNLATFPSPSTYIPSSTSTSSSSFTSTSTSTSSSNSTFSNSPSQTFPTSATSPGGDRPLNASLANRRSFNSDALNASSSSRRSFSSDVLTVPSSTSSASPIALTQLCRNVLVTHFGLRVLRHMLLVMRAPKCVKKFLSTLNARECVVRSPAPLLDVFAEPFFHRAVTWRVVCTLDGQPYLATYGHTDVTALQDCRWSSSSSVVEEDVGDSSSTRWLWCHHPHIMRVWGLVLDDVTGNTFYLLDTPIATLDQIQSRLRQRSVRVPEDLIWCVIACVSSAVEHCVARGLQYTPLLLSNVFLLTDDIAIENGLTRKKQLTGCGCPPAKGLHGSHRPHKNLAVPSEGCLVHHVGQIILALITCHLRGSCSNTNRSSNYTVAMGGGSSTTTGKSVGGSDRQEQVRLSYVDMIHIIRDQYSGVLLYLLSQTLSGGLPRAWAAISGGKDPLIPDQTPRGEDHNYRGSRSSSTTYAQRTEMASDPLLTEPVFQKNVTAVTRNPLFSDSISFDFENYDIQKTQKKNIRDDFTVNRNDFVDSRDSLGMQQNKYRMSSSQCHPPAQTQSLLISDAKISNQSTRPKTKSKDRKQLSDKRQKRHRKTSNSLNPNTPETNLASKENISPNITNKSKDHESGKSRKKLKDHCDIQRIPLHIQTSTDASLMPSSLLMKHDSISLNQIVRLAEEQVRAQCRGGDLLQALKECPQKLVQLALSESL